MSSILKALKKLEEEKAFQQEGTGVNVSHDILRQHPQNRRIFVWLWIAGISALSIIVILVVLLLKAPLLKDMSEAVPVAATPSIEHTTVHPPTGHKPSPPAVNIIKAATPTLLDHNQPARPVQPPPKQPSEDNRNRPEPAASPVQEAHRSETGSKSLQPVMADQPDTTLTLSGIAWNKDSADRLAIINGLPTVTGAIVAGVVVEEIMPDRVRVKSAGRSFDIFLGKPARPE